MNLRKWRPWAGGALLLACAAAAAPQTPSGNKGGSPLPWLMEYGESGGMDGRVLHITFASDGEVSATGGLRGAWQSRFRASAEQLRELRTLVDGLKLSGTPQPQPPKPEPIPDMLYSHLEVTRGGTKYPVAAPPARLVAILRALLDEGRTRAEDQKWRKAGDFQLGRVWHVREEVRDREGRWHGENWNGTWTRQGESKVFHAVWRNSKTQQEVQDTVELESAGGGKVVLHRPTAGFRYDGQYAAENPHQVSGYVDACPHCYWTAQIEY